MTGGTDKGLSLSPLVNVLTKTSKYPVKALYLLSGSATEKLQAELKKSRKEFFGPFDSLEELLTLAKSQFEKDGKNLSSNKKQDPEEIFVFSPGATSFGMFTNEFDRGNKYMTAVKRIFT